MLTYLFPGQGAQAKGMGNNLFDIFPDEINIADKVLGYSIKSLCLEDPLQQLNQTQYTQPAIFVVNALTYLKKINETQQKPDYVSGHSLGEYNALFAAEVFNFETGLQLIKKRGELMSQVMNGAMAAIVGLKSNEIKNLLEQNNLTQIEIANYNSYTQYVISGLKNDIEQAQKIFSNINSVNFIPLKVSGAFHSSYMRDAQEEFAKFLKSFEFHTPTLPVIANLDAQPYHPAIAKTNLAKQITHPVLWTNIIEYLNTQGSMTFEEVGSGTILTGLLRRIHNNQ